MEIIHQKSKKKNKQNEKSLRDLCDKIKQHLHYWGPRRKREEGVENIFDEIMTENFPKLQKEIDIQVEEAQRVPNKMNLNKSTTKYIVIKMANIKDKEIILKAAKEKQSQ